MNGNEKSGKREHSRHDLGRMPLAEYKELVRKHPPAGSKVVAELRRLSEEEYEDMWDGSPPSEQEGG